MAAETLLAVALTAVFLATPASMAEPLSESKKFEGSSKLVHLTYHMGPVLTANVVIHILWYGSWSPRQKHVLRSFIRSLSHHSAPPPSVSQWWRTVTLYTDQTGANVTRHVSLGSERSDRFYSHGRALTRLTVQHVIRSAVNARRNPLPVNPRGGIYLILTSADVAVQDFCEGACGFHYFTFPSIVGYTLPYAWVGNSGGRCPEICAYPFATPPPNGDAGVDGMVSVIGHELAELATNPLVNAWYAGADPSFPTEIADLCQGIYGSGGGGAYAGNVSIDERNGARYNVNGENGRRFLLQWLWHPYLRCCFGPNAVDL